MDSDPYYLKQIRIQVFLIQIRIQENDTGSTDPDLPHWCGGSVFFCPIRIRTFFFGFRLWIRKGSGSESDLKQDFVSVSEFKSFKSARRQENTTILSEIKTPLESGAWIRRKKFGSGSSKKIRIRDTQCGGSGSVESISFPLIRIRIKKRLDPEFRSGIHHTSTI